MTQIDWKTGPVGATHFLPAKSNCHSDIFILMDGMTVRKVGYPGGDRWAHTYTEDGQPNIELIRAISKRDEPKEWTGEGLPPVGTVCEVQDPNDPAEWYECRIIAHDSEIAVFKSESEYPWMYDGQCSGCFRKIRTPEQIKEDERAEAIEAMAKSSLYGHYAFTSAQAKIACTVLFDAGYRKMMSDAEEVKS